jgi:hypothetical protein
MKHSGDITGLASVAEMPSWAELNRQWLVAEIARLAQRLEAADSGDAHDAFAPTAFTPALIHCASAFGLSLFEQQLLLLVAGLQLDGRLRQAVAARNADGLPRASFSLALESLAQPHWDALSPDSALRHWRMIELEPGLVLTHATIQIDERILHFLSGVPANDGQLTGVGTLIDPESTLTDRAEPPLTDLVARALASGGSPPIVAIRGDRSEPAALRSAALASIASLGKLALWLSAGDLPADAATLSLLARHVDREAALTGIVPVIAVEGGSAEHAAAGLAGRLHGPCLWLGSTDSALSALPRTVLRFELPAPAAHRTRDWLLASCQREIPDAEDEPFRFALDRAAGQFHLGPAALGTMIERLAATPPAARAAAVWPMARESARGGLESLAQRVVTDVGFDDLVLPAGHLATLRDVARHLRHRERVYRDWGFGEKHALGQGLVALFAGESGTGKTLAAEAIANAVELDLYRVDLAMLVSKYIGETEKNLKSLFDAAETSGAVLLFDEADALFGKRSEVKDSHDRYANIEVAYLLQRLEAYRGLAILTTNIKSALDRAFLRRVRFVVNFPFPDAAAREQIWRRQFPAAAPVGEVDYAALSQLNIAGGNIRSIALNAAFKAADDGACIHQAILIDAARGEFAKLERSIGQAGGGGS